MATLARMTVDLLARTDDFRSGLDAAATKLKNVGERMSDVGKSLSTRVTAPIVGMGVAAIKMAADAEESASKLEAVFGPSTERVAAAIAKMRDTIPATTHQLNAMTAEIGDLLMPLGIAPDLAENMSLEIVQLAADLASFNNIPIEEAFQRIQSGLVGQTQPLLKFGSAINAARIQTRAMEMGLISQGQALDAAGRATVVFDLLLQDTTAAQGDAARTAASTANQIKFLWAEIREAAAVIGAELLPVVTPWIARMVELTRSFQGLSPEMKRAILVVGAIAAAVGPVLVVLGTFLKVVGFVAAGIAALNPVSLTIIGVLAALAAAVAAGVLVWQKFGDEIGRIWAALVAGVMAQVDRLVAVFDRIRGATQAVTGFFADMFNKVVGNSYVPDMVAGVTTEFGKLQKAMVEPAKDAAARVNEAFRNIAQPDALRRLNFNVSMDAEALYASVIAGGEAAGAQMLEFAAGTAAANRAVVGVSESWGDALRVANELTAANREQAQANRRLQQQTETLAIVTGNASLPTRELTRETLDLTAGISFVVPRLNRMSEAAEVTTERAGLLSRGLDGMQAMVAAGGSSLTGALGKMGSGAGAVLSKLTPMGFAAETIGRVFDALKPAIEAIEPVFVVLARALAAGLMPILKLLFPVFKLLGIAATYVAEVFFRVAQGWAWAMGTLIKGIGKLIDKIPGVSGKGLINAGNSMLDTSRGFADAARAQGEARDELRALTWPAEAAEAAAEQTAALDRNADIATESVAATHAVEVAIKEETGVLTSLLGVAREIRDSVRDLELSPTIHVQAPGGVAMGTGGAGALSQDLAAEWIAEVRASGSTTVLR